MARAVRKQLYLTAEHDRFVKELAARWDTTEAAVVRKALDDLAEREKRHQPDRRTDKKKLADELLRRAGMLGGGWKSPIPTKRQLDAMAARITSEERELLQRRTERLGGGNDVIADREERTRIIAGQPLDD